MVFSLLKNAVIRKSAEIQRVELQYFIDCLAGADDDDLGLPVAIATHFRNGITSIDLLHPFTIVDATVPIQLINSHKKLQKEGDYVSASGLSVWIHTMRAVNAPTNRELARTMWGNLRRGFPYAEDAALRYEKITGREVNCSGFNLIPDGFEPRRP